MTEPSFLGGTRRRDVGTRLTLVARQLWQRFDRRVEGIGVSRAQWRVIAAVASHPGAMQRMIAELLEISEVTAGRLIDRLCAEGYLERRSSATDRRARSLHLTPLSQPVLDQLGALARISEGEAFAGISAQDLARFEVLLDRIAQNVARARAAGATHEEEEV